MNRRVLLVSPPMGDISQTAYILMPLGLLSIAAYLQTRAYEPQVLDANVIIRKMSPKTDDELMELLSREIRAVMPAVLGISIMAAGHIEIALAIMKVAKNVCENVVTVCGGAHASQFAVTILENCPDIDYVVLGEGEAQSAWIAQNTDSCASSGAMPDGIAYRVGGEIRVIPKRTFIASIDSLPIPAYDLVRREDYANDTTGWHNPLGLDLSARVPIMTSRGCPYRCNFCSISMSMGHRFRPMSANRVVQMLQMLCEQHGVRVAAVHDANFAQDTKRVLEICNEISKRNLKLAMDVYTGVPLNATSIEAIHALAAIGLVRLGLSIESGDLRIRNEIMGKNFEDDQIYAVIDACRQHPEVFVGADFVLGMPEDTEESLDKSVSLMKRLDVDEVDMSVATPFPGTRLYAQCVRDRLFFDDIKLDELWRAKDYSWNDTRRFTIKPYKLGYEQLCHYANVFLKLRSEKIATYRDRMKKVYGIDSKYGLGLTRFGGHLPKGGYDVHTE